MPPKKSDNDTEHEIRLVEIKAQLDELLAQGQDAIAKLLKSRAEAEALLDRVNAQRQP